MSRVKIVGDTVHPTVLSARNISFEIYAPRILLVEINTHRIIAKSAQSSRAIPVEKRIKDLDTEPYIPVGLQRNCPGMQAKEEMSEAEREQGLSEWNYAIYDARKHAQRMAEIGAHKQWANRLIEPFVHFYGILSGTEWDNFFKLRLSAAAQPEFEELARLMKEAMDASAPIVDRSHLPYVEVDMRLNPEKYAVEPAQLPFISAARCARVSYKSHDGTAFDAKKDLKLCFDLIDAGHLSPFDHPAIADTTYTVDQNEGSGIYTHLPVIAPGTYWEKPDDHRHLWGWSPLRVEVEKERGWTLRRNSYAPITL